MLVELKMLDTQKQSNDYKPQENEALRPIQVNL